MLTLKAVPAVWLAMVAILNAVAVPAATVKLAEVPVSGLWAAVNVVLWASYSVIDAVPTPAVNVTEAGYSGAVTVGPGLLAGPENVMVSVPA